MLEGTRKVVQIEMAGAKSRTGPETLVVVAEASPGFLGEAQLCHNCQRSKGVGLGFSLWKMCTVFLGC